ncbi:flagellar protein FlgN [Paenibacillus farraposensis]|uniref:Flagellar protein FlgN n=2 Tax=Paenibacillus farraposensis TaxID=2807095 RepID=A0ABW4DCJ9_9BACL|nr:flagellar protein FlgN [Paenibacillus farraposensis]MCC3379477.1 flagellar protein FlgN [Paenibacillus farraposensis]
MPLERLIDVLEQLDQKHLILLELAKSKKKIVMENDINSLVQHLKQESRLLKQVEELEEARMEVSYELLRERGIRSQLNLTITELARLVFDPEDKNKLLSVQSRLSHTLSELKEVNAINQKLIEQSLVFIDYSLDLLVGRPNQEMTYMHPDQKSNQLARPGLLDTKA